MFTITQNPNSEISKAARQLVTLKYNLDTLARTNPKVVPDPLHGPMSGGEWGPHFGKDFLSEIMPFIEFLNTDGETQVVNAPTLHVFGCSWRIWPDPNITKTEKKRVIQYINSEQGILGTSYTYIPELCLYLPSEGKNRVNFCRYHDITSIPPRITVRNYPKPERIKIYTYDLAGSTDVWAILDNTYAQKLGHFAYSLPMLRAYNVSISNEWPKDIPTPSELIAAHVRTHNVNSYDLINIPLIKQRVEALERKEPHRHGSSLLDIKLTLRSSLVFSTVVILVALVAI